MLRTRIKRDARSGEQALRRLVEIEASLAKLTDDDILDLADIFATQRDKPLGEIAFAEMEWRNISL